MMIAVAKDERAKKYPSLTAPEHRVPHRRGVIGGLDPVPRAVRLFALRAQPGIHQPGAGSDLAGICIDEKGTHQQRG